MKVGITKKITGTGPRLYSRASVSATSKRVRAIGVEKRRRKRNQRVTDPLESPVIDLPWPQSCLNHWQDNQYQALERGAPRLLNSLTFYPPFFPPLHASYFLCHHQASKTRAVQCSRNPGVRLSTSVRDSLLGSTGGILAFTSLKSEPLFCL